MRRNDTSTSRALWIAATPVSAAFAAFAAISILVGAQTKGQFHLIYGQEGTQALFTGLARQHKQTIVAGTHVHARGDRLYNGAHVFFPDGRVIVQDKLHLTPTEVSPWAITPGEKPL